MANSRSDRSLFPLFQLYKDVRIMHVYPNFSMHEISLFARTSHQSENETSQARLLMSAAYALPESYQQKYTTKLAAIAILKKYPELLFKKGYVKDPAGHLIYGSAYQVFLGAGDIWARKTVHKEIIPLIENGEAIAEEQYKEQFPRHVDESLTEEERLYDDRNIAQIAQVDEDLKEIAAAFEEDPCTGDTPTKQRTIDAIDSLLLHLAPNEEEVIKTGMHMPPKIMEMIHKVYDEHYSPWEVEKMRVYSLKVIGGAEKVATAVDAQCYKKGLNHIEKNFEPDRSVSYLTSSGVPAGLGDFFFIDVYSGAGQRWAVDASGYLGNLCRTKTSGLQSLCSHAELKRPSV